MEKRTVNNKRMKMSPGGIITLTVAARKALGMKVNEGAQVSVKAEKDAIVISGRPSREEKTWKVSPKGQMSLGGDAKALLLKSKGRHYWLELDDAANEARLRAF